MPDIATSGPIAWNSKVPPLNPDVPPVSGTESAQAMAGHESVRPSISKAIRPTAVATSRTESIVSSPFIGTGPTVCVPAYTCEPVQGAPGKSQDANDATRFLGAANECQRGEGAALIVGGGRGGGLSLRICSDMLSKPV